MPYHVPIHTDDDLAPHTDRPARHVLVLDDDAEVRDVLERALASRQLQVHHAPSLEAGRRLIRRTPIDLALIDLKLPDGSGLDLARQLARRGSGVPAVLLAGRPGFDDLLHAMRAGACDYLAKPFDIEQLNRCVDRALQRHRESRRLVGRVHRLRRICRKLNQARIETTQQVDMICNDLVTAYQELAGQFNQVQTASKFAAAIEGELSLEPLLRRTLQFILEQVGSTNATIFLPGRETDYTTGGYVNYTFDRQTASILLPQLAELVAPRIAEQDQPLQHIGSDTAIRDWLDGETANLDGCEVATFPCRHEDEMLAGVCLFRDNDEPFEREQLERVAGIAPALAQQLVRIIRVHHRLDFSFDDEQTGGSDEWPKSE